MDLVLKKFCPRISFQSYEDFRDNFSINIPHDFNFAYDVVDEWARCEPQKTALVWCDDAGNEKTFTFSDISRLSQALAHSLINRGIGKGDIVMCLLRRRWEYWIVAVALCRIGATIIPATIQLTSHDIEYRCNTCGVKGIFCIDDDYVCDQVKAAFPQCDSLENCFIVGEARDDWMSFDELLDEGKDLPLSFDRLVKTRAEDTMLIYFTSGTTGYPKPVMHNYVHPLGHIITAKYWQQVQENTLHMSVTDSGWAKFGWGKIYGQWIAGAAIFAYDMDRFVPSRLLQHMQDYKITTFCAPPTMYRFMLQEDVASYDLSAIANFATAGEPLNAEVTVQWEKLTGKKIREGFGQSEGVVLIATFPWLEPVPGSMGKPSPLFNIKLLDENGEEVEEGEEGSICVTKLKESYPPGLFVGYYGMPDKTAEAVGHDYYDLHDMAWRNHAGYISFVGRNDDVIKCSGYRISPFEVESALVKHDSVVECAVTAAPDPIRGLVVKATVVLAEGFTASDSLTKELQAWVKKETAPYKYPRIIEYVAELPKTIGGKIKRKYIRNHDGVED